MRKVKSFLKELLVRSAIGLVYLLSAAVIIGSLSLVAFVTYLQLKEYSRTYQVQYMVLSPMGLVPAGQEIITHIDRNADGSMCFTVVASNTRACTKAEMFRMQEVEIK